MRSQKAKRGYLASRAAPTFPSSSALLPSRRASTAPEPGRPRDAAPLLDREVFLTQLGVVKHVARGAVEDHLPHVEDDRTIGERERRDRVLLDYDGGESSGLHLVQDLLDLAHDDGRQALV